MYFLKITFYISNPILFLFYLYPGSILGCIITNDCDTQPQILNQSVFLSLNHILIFILFSILGFFAYYKNFKNILIYLIVISIFLELAQIIVPIRTFQVIDLISNLLGIMISIVIDKLFNIWKQKNKEINKIV